MSVPATVPVAAWGARWIKDGYRKNSNPVMVTALKTLSDEELDAVADYLSRL